MFKLPSHFFGVCKIVQILIVKRGIIQIISYVQILFTVSVRFTDVDVLFYSEIIVIKNLLNNEILILLYFFFNNSNQIKIIVQTIKLCDRFKHGFLIQCSKQWHLFRICRNNSWNIHIFYKKLDSVWVLKFLNYDQSLSTQIHSWFS